MLLLVPVASLDRPRPGAAEFGGWTSQRAAAIR